MKLGISTVTKCQPILLIFGVYIRYAYGTNVKVYTYRITISIDDYYLNKLFTIILTTLQCMLTISRHI